MNFTELWTKKYPAKGRLKGNKRAAEKCWDRLNMYERHAVELSLPVYEEHLGEHPWKNPMHLSTYLGPNRHWESFQPPEKVQGQIDEIEARREQNRKRIERDQAYADEQWADKFEKQFGYRPNTVRS